MLGPRVNAGGRIGVADLGARLLATDDPHEAAALAARLHALNAERREIEAAVRVDGRGAGGGARPTGRWSGPPARAGIPGVVGIVAARLKETFDRPAVVIGFDGGEGKGSARSVTGVDLGAADRAADARGSDRARRRPPHGGGADPRRRRSWSRRWRGSASSSPPQGAAARAGARPAARRHAGAGRARRRSSPSGSPPPAPTAPARRRRGWRSPAARIAGARRIGEGHLALALADGCGGRLDAVAFRALEGPLGAFLHGAPAARARTSPGGSSATTGAGASRVKLHVEDAAPALG